MTSRHFRGISSIQEVECWGGYLNADVKLISLQIFKLPETIILASLNVLTSSCMTFGDFSSCAVNGTNNHNSRVRVLVHDLEEGEIREYGCTANTVNPLGNSIYRNWKMLLVRNSKWVIIFSSFCMVPLSLAQLCITMIIFFCCFVLVPDIYCKPCAFF